MFDFLKKPFEKIRARRELIKRRDQALSEANNFGLDFKADFTNYSLSASESYSRESKSKASHSKIEHDCKREVERIMSVVFRRWDNERAPRRLRYDRFMYMRSIGPADVIVAVKLHGVGIKGGPYTNYRNRTGDAITGARMTGTISLCLCDLPPFTRSFTGTIYPPTSIPEYEAWGGPPFVKAIRASGLEKTLRDILNRFYSSPDTNIQD